MTKTPPLAGGRFRFIGVGMTKRPAIIPPTPERRQRSHPARADMSGLTKLAAIRVGERTRRDLGDVAALAASIKEHGLIHPVVITPNGELIAGERRFEAFRLLGRSEIPTRVLDLIPAAMTSDSTGLFNCGLA